MRKRYRRILRVLCVVLSFAAPAAAEPWSVPAIDGLPDDAWGRTVRFGRDLTVATPTLIGPEVTDPTRRFAGNNLSCQNCHLNAGTGQFALPFVGVFADFPQYRAREGRVGTIEDRINGCMTRSMNGRELPLDGPEMKAIVAYLKFLSTGIPVGAARLGAAPSKCRCWVAPPTRRTARLYTHRPAPSATGRTVRANATGSPATVAVMRFRRCGDRTASTTAPA